MKKRMRKAVAIAATAAMVGSLPAGAVTAQAADDDITIGVSIWSSTDVLGSQSKKIIDKAADALGVNVMYVDQGHVSEQVTASVEQLCAAGCNGIVICNSADSEMTSPKRTALTYIRQHATHSILLVQFMKTKYQTDIHWLTCFLRTVTETSALRHGQLVMLHSSRDGQVTNRQLTNGTKLILMIRQQSQSLYTLIHLPKKVQQQLFPFTTPTLIWTL